MNFQDYCDTTSQIDRQKITITNTFLIGFSNTTGQAFSLDPTVAVNFLRFLSQPHAKCYAAWEEIQTKKDNFTQYEEKSYRAIFSSTQNDEGLNAISSLGGSQTKTLAIVLSKLICYLGNFDYVGVSINTYFDLDSVQKALNAVPVDLTKLANVSELQKSFNLEERFKDWMRGKNLAEKSISSYGNFNLANQMIRISTSEFNGVFSVVNVTILDDVISKLESIQEWTEKNDSGNGMYIAGLKKYREFLLFFNNKLPIPKPFLLLAGISGTGKTRFVRDQAAAHRGGDLTNYCLIPVRPDWHEPSDLLGYVSRLGSNGSACYVVTDLLRFVVQAWQDAAAPGAASDTKLPCKSPDEMTPFWLCLDEMNLAPVEQYFADYLSVVETRKWDKGNYTCDPLLKGATIKQLDDDGRTALRKELKLEDSQYDGLWGYFLEKGVPLPPNLIVAGTVNMDETTHGFSRKVIDRAFTIDFGVFYPNDFAEYFEEDKISLPKTLSFPLISKVTRADLVDAGLVEAGTKSIEFMAAINTVLSGSPFELAYRALNELLLAVVCFNPTDDDRLYAVWDDFLMSKVLPRIDGDGEKLQQNGDVSLLTRLSDEIASQFKSKAKSRPDLLRENSGGECRVPWRAAAKLAWMQKRLDANGFTTFWP